ncbi:MAG: PPOX class F420-dependent oxidoreductase [Anaerolineales bacterium]|jgi:PPOX class probable F420-dependent enzyme
MNRLEPFAHQKYLNLETFRRNGEGVKTPVWFAQEGELLYIVTLGSSGKVKRIRNHGRVNVAPCRMNGKVVGSWVPALAREVTEPEVKARVDRLLDHKYGLMRKLFGGQRAGRGARDTVLEIKLLE